MVKTIPIPTLTEAEQVDFNRRYIHSKQRFNGTRCWLWERPTSIGYGKFTIRGGNYQAHRVAYEMNVGVIPEGHTIDHLCRRRACVNHTHLEPVSMRDNTLRGIGPTAANAVKTHCVNGHEFNEKNTYLQKRGTMTSRICRPCKLASYHRNKRAALEPKGDGA